MPFKSKAQQRFMYSQHPEIARRWTDEMRGGKKASKMQREHPINHSGIPERVGKGTWVNPEIAPLARRALHDASEAASVSVRPKAAKPKAGFLGGMRGPRKQPRYAGGAAFGKRYVEVTKGVTTQGVKPVLALRKPSAGTLVARRLSPKPSGAPIGKAEVAKFGIGEGLKAIKTAGRVARGGFQHGMGGKARLSIGEMAHVKRSPGLQRIGQAGKFTAENRGAVGLGTGIVGGSVLAGAMHRDDMSKAHGDPEDARYARLGAGAATLAGAGIGSTGYGAHRVRRDTLRERNRFKDVPRLKVGNEPTKPSTERLASMAGDKEREDSLKRHETRHGEWRGRKAVEDLRTRKLRGVVVRGRPAAFVGGGLAALGGAEALRRRASERRWN